MRVKGWPLVIRATAATANVIGEHVCAERDERDGEKLSNRKFDAEQGVQQKDRAENNERRAPRQRVAGKTTRDDIVFGVGRESGAHQLRRAARVNRRVEQRADDAENEKERHAACDDSHLKEAGEDREVNDGLGRLPVVSRAESRDDGEQRRDKRRTLAPHVACCERCPLLLLQRLDADDDAVLAKRKAANAMVAGWAQWPRATAALHGCRIS